MENEMQQEGEICLGFNGAEFLQRRPHRYATLAEAQGPAAVQKLRQRGSLMFLFRMEGQA